MLRLCGAIVALGLLVLSGCGPVFELTYLKSRDEMAKRCSLALVGVIESQVLEDWPNYRVSLPAEEEDSKYWRILRRRIRVEYILQGSESRKLIDVFEVYWTGGATGDWNSTREGQRVLLLLRMEKGHYRLVQDWRRSVFPVAKGRHFDLKFHKSRPLWEKFALMNFWIPQDGGDVDTGRSYTSKADPGGALRSSRVVRLLRGLLRHHNSSVRLAACGDLLEFQGFGLDECWDLLSQDEKTQLMSEKGASLEAQIAKLRDRNRQWGASRLWRWYPAREDRVLVTVTEDRKVREEFCKLYIAEYGDDRESGCPASLPLPASIVTSDGDVPLPGLWPR